VVPVAQCPSAPLEIDGCFRNIDCGASTICLKEPGAGIDDPGCCSPIECVDDTQCSTDQVCDVSTGVCVLPPVCEADGPQATPCADDEPCRWDLGVAMCGDERPAPIVCAASPAFLHAAPGDVVTWDVIGLDALGNRQPLEGPITLSGDVLDDGPHGEATARCDGASCAGRVLIDGPGVFCWADLIVTAQRPAFTNVRLVDADTGAPLAGQIHVRRADGGETVEVGDDGLAALFTGEPWAAVTGLAEGYRVLTVLEPPEGDLVLPLRTTAVAAATAWPTEGDTPRGDVDLFFVGVSIASPLHELSLEALWGPAEVVDLSINTFGTQTFAGRLPTGFAVSSAKPATLAFGAAGDRQLWTLGTSLSLEVSFELLNGSMPTRAAARHALDVLRRASWFYAGHSAADLTDGPLPFPEGAQPLDYAAFEPVNATGFGGAPLVPLQHPYWDVDIEVPALPCPATCASEAFVIVGVEVPARGFVPLGWAVRADRELDEPVDQVVTAVGADPVDGVVRVSVAPPHDGLEGLPLTGLVLMLGPSVDEGDGRPDVLLRYDALTVGEVNVPPVSEVGPPVAVELLGTEAMPVLTWSASGSWDAVHVELALGDAAWELFATRVPSSPTDLFALLPEQAAGAVQLNGAQSLRLASEGASVDALLGLGGDELSSLDEGVIEAVRDR
jgi:hypothetical protein